MQGTVTITFGDQAENHVGMQKIGELADVGFTHEDLLFSQELLLKEGVTSELIDLCKAGNVSGAEPAYVLIIRNSLETLFGETADNLFKEQSTLTVDKQARMYGRVVNKHARWNLCFSETAQEPDYINGKGRIVAYSQVPLLEKLRKTLPVFFGDKAASLVAEGNYYYDITKCGIGYHGDFERKRVIALRLGETMPLHYQWFQGGVPVGDRIPLTLGHGDMYVMSEKATGCDWKKKLVKTLRHAAGAKKYLK